jgi:hypothetical protein
MIDIHSHVLPFVDDGAQSMWMKNSGLQWLRRLLQEPRRFWKRYLINNPKFIWNIKLQFLGEGRHSASDWALVCGIESVFRIKVAEAVVFPEGKGLNRSGPRPKGDKQGKRYQARNGVTCPLSRSAIPICHFVAQQVDGRECLMAWR